MFFLAAETPIMIRRSFSSLAVLLTVSVSIPIYGQTAESPSGDRFADTLQELQQRMQALETQNARLESELKAQRQSDIGDQPEPDEPKDSESLNGSEEAPDSLEDLLKATEKTDDRLSKIEEGIKKDADAAKKKKEEDTKKEKKWFEKYTIRGYAQFRVNEVFDNDGPAKAHHVGDSSIGDNQSFLIRRARLIFSGDVSEHLSLYFQPDFASNVPGSPDANQFAQIRDLYADVALDDEKELRLRIGQSKVPYGWENLQSSSNRLPLDRSDSLNSAVRNERDLGIFCYWTPVEVQHTFKYIMDEGLKGSGNYGLFGVGVYNGQGGSFREQNDELHAVARVAYPFWLNDSQLVEVGMQGYTGQYTVLTSPISPLGVGAATAPGNNPDGIKDERLAWTFIYYPQPIGFQSEWTVGRGPSLNDAQTNIGDSALYGGYAMAMYRQKLEKGELIPFARWNYYQGGYKTERNSPRTQIEEWEFGTEWQFSKSLEFVAMYTITDRTNTQAIGTANTLSYEQFNGQLLRFQVQVNY